MAQEGKFSQRIQRIAQDVEAASVEAMRKVALAVDAAVVLGTPVDTGRARSNWRVSIGTPVDGEIPPYKPGSHLGLGETANAAKAMEQGYRTIYLHNDTSDIWISNNVPYINMLEHGHSPQNSRFVRAAVQKGLYLLRDFTLLGLRRRFRGN